MASERDETESEIASVSDTKDLPDIEQIEEDSRGMDEDDDIKIIEGGEAHILHKRGGRGKGATALPVVSSAAVSPSSPALSTGRLVKNVFHNNSSP